MELRKRQIHPFGSNVAKHARMEPASRLGILRHAHHRLPLPLVAALGVRAVLQAQELSPTPTPTTAAATPICARTTSTTSSTAGPSGSTSTSSSSTWTGSATRSTSSAQSVRSRCSSPTCRGEEGREAAIHWNEEMAGAQKKYPGRLWASAAVPLRDTRIAIEVLDDAVGRLGLMGVNMPGSIGSRSAHRRRAARAVLRPRRGARPSAVPASDRRGVRRRAHRL